MIFGRAEGDAIIARAARLTDESVASIKGPCRQRDLAYVRFAVMWAMRKATGLSLPRIGRLLGDRDHTTIRHGIRRAETLRAECAEFRELSERLAG